MESRGHGGRDPFFSRTGAVKLCARAPLTVLIMVRKELVSYGDLPDAVKLVIWTAFVSSAGGKVFGEGV